jgi:hypothetical protein
MGTLRVAHAGTNKTPTGYYVAHAGVNKPVLALYVRNAAGTGNEQVFASETAQPFDLFGSLLGGFASLSWTNESALYAVEVWRDGVLHDTEAAGTDAWLGAHAGSHDYKVRYSYGGGLYSDFSNEVTVS